ncbi:hypothetical protein K2173_006871 [Erythroxylum novogranatense]|uniref:Uncharacterized protein n=1 Tax=Erythroxylum novogranatense TaxID=1862640 RepID=A0AAV8SXZ6_9ROSI|nr:hypothetical protein K2173_006871 [Erythroxylum novogranatense]
MAFRATSKLWTSAMLGRSFASATAPKFGPSIGATPSNPRPHNKYSISGEFAPVYIVAGFVTVAVGMALHSMKQQLIHSPSVNLTKKRRGTMAEVEFPDTVVANSDKFINKSFLRKVAHIQDPSQRTLQDPSRPNPFTKDRQAETLKSVGVNPRSS